METTSTLFANIILNGLLLTFIVALSILIGIAVIKFIQKGLQADREEFETRVLSLLENIKRTLETRNVR